MLSVALPDSASAAKIDFTPVVSITETYTDNVGLDAPGAEKDDWVTAATAGFNFSGTGARARLNLSYSPTLYTFVRQNQTDLRHNLSNAGEMELVEDHLYLSESAQIYQSFAGSQRDISISDANLTGDRRQVYVFSVSPQLRNRFGSVASASLGYSLGAYYADAPADPLAAGASDSLTHSVSASIVSGEDFQRLSWTINGSWRKQKRFGGATSVDDRNVRATSRYNLNRLISLTGSVGYQDFGHSFGAGYGGLNWDAGFRLTPSRRVTLAVSYGRLTGNNRLTFSGSYQPSDRTAVSVSYNETFQTTQSLLNEQLPTLDTQPALGVGLGLGSSFNSFGSTDIPGSTFTDQVFLQKRFNFAARHTIGRTSFQFSAYRDIRTINGVETSRVISGSGSLNRTFSTLLSGRVNGSYIRRDDPTGRMDDIYLASATLNRTLVGTASAYLSYQLTKRTSNVASADLTENAVTFGLSTRF